MARPREPINILKAKGRKHLTKSEIEYRKESEVQAPGDKVKAPSYLNAKLKREFTKIAKQLIDIGIMTNLDIDALARFIMSREIYIKLSTEIIEHPALVMTDKYPQIAINQDKAFKQCRAAASDLGLTISSRCRLIMPNKEEKPAETDFDRKFGNV